MQKLSGIETARAIREYDRKSVIVFVTAMKEYVFEAFDVAAFHYLLKPFDEKKFTEVFGMLLRVIVLTVENGLPELIYNKYPVLILVVPAILILCLLTIIYGVKLFQDMIYLNRERNSRAILEKQVSSMQEHIAEMEHIHSGNNRLSDRI